jgi:hypothetical protein
MKVRRCRCCKEPLPSWARIDKLTCSPACRTRLYRQRKDARDTFVTPCRPQAPRPGEEWSIEPVRNWDAVPEALSHSGQLALWLATERGTGRTGNQR